VVIKDLCSLSETGPAELQPYHNSLTPYLSSEKQRPISGSISGFN
jgi:hypothetical protein